MIWKTLDGRELEIKNMSTDHIKNCMKLIKSALIMCEGLPPIAAIIIKNSAEKDLKGFNQELRRRMS